MAVVAAGNASSPVSTTADFFQAQRSKIKVIAKPKCSFVVETHHFDGVASRLTCLTYISSLSLLDISPYFIDPKPTRGDINLANK